MPFPLEKHTEACISLFSFLATNADVGFFFRRGAEGTDSRGAKRMKSLTHNFANEILLENTYKYFNNQLNILTITK